jgi:ADP-Ribosyltransferase in polyvalent proteins
MDADFLNVPSGKRLQMSPHQYLDTPKFKAWFGESKIVDGEGQPLAMFHGRSRRESLEGMDVFPTNGYKGAYFTSKPDYASGYAIEFRAEKPSGNFEPSDQTGSVYKVYLSIKNPLYIDAKDATKVDDYQQYGQDLYPERLLAQGYDGVVLDWGNGEVEATAFSPTQIKSDFNTGTWDARDLNILH